MRQNVSSEKKHKCVACGRFVEPVRDADGGRPEVPDRCGSCAAGQAGRRESVAASSVRLGKIPPRRARVSVSELFDELDGFCTRVAKYRNDVISDDPHTAYRLSAMLYNVQECRHYVEQMVRDGIIVRCGERTGGHSWSGKDDDIDYCADCTVQRGVWRMYVSWRMAGGKEQIDVPPPRLHYTETVVLLAACRNGDFLTHDPEEIGRLWRNAAPNKDDPDSPWLTCPECHNVLALRTTVGENYNLARRPAA